MPTDLQQKTLPRPAISYKKTRHRGAEKAPRQQRNHSNKLRHVPNLQWELTDVAPDQNNLAQKIKTFETKIRQTNQTRKMAKTTKGARTGNVPTHVPTPKETRQDQTKN